MRLLLGILFLYYICMVCVTIVTMYKRKYKEYIITKTLASTGFMLIGIAVSMSYYQPLLLAFLCCFAGDVLLALSNEIDNELRSPQFPLGVVAFTIGHVIIMMEFGKMLGLHVGFCWILAPLAMLAYTVFTATALKKYFDYGNNFISICIYAVIVGLCGGMGIDALLNCDGSASAMVMGLGALCFMISDGILSHKYFCKIKPKCLGAGVLIFYYGAVGMLAISPLLG